MNSCALARRGGVDDLRVGRAAPAVGDVLANRAVEQERLLLHDREQAAGSWRA